MRCARCYICQSPGRLKLQLRVFSLVDVLDELRDDARVDDGLNGRLIRH